MVLTEKSVLVLSSLRTLQSASARHRRFRYHGHEVYDSAYINQVYPGAGKHPSPLEKKKKKKKKKKKHTHTQTNSPHQNITVGFYRIKKYCSYQKLWRFFCDFLPAPIDRKFDVRDR